VAPGVYRGAQPEAAGYATLKKRVHEGSRLNF